MVGSGREQTTMKLATIDIGTNTVLLLVASINPAGSLIPCVYEQRIPRLGRGVDAQRMLQSESIARVIAVMREYAQIIGGCAVDSVVVCGTSAVRDAANRQELADAIRRETGYSLEVLSGEDEAIWTYRGAVSGIPPADGYAVVLDIGGGSTEMSLGDGSTTTRHCSIDIGSVRLTERCFHEDPPSARGILEAIAIIDSSLASAEFAVPSNAQWVGVAGTATTLGLVAQGRTSFSMEGVTNTRLTYSQVVALRRRFETLPVKEIRNISSVLEGRADVILAGTLILQRIMERNHLDEITISERGLRYGLALREWERMAGNPTATASSSLPV
jgi:exopolyphosphatase / guanosine-5'-triphosphate,3'-diphosphate pyrophosphatase